MNPETLVQAVKLAKRYPARTTARARYRALWDALAGRQPRRDRVALDEVSLQVRAGEAVAIVGENGAGKSTLLKLIAGVLRPTAGSIQVRGRLCAMLELGAGFQPEFSGRSNARLAATLAGVDGDALDEVLPQIIDFAELGEWIDRPVKTYSSGMTVRLGFAVNAVVRPDLLITDEVLAVGDVAFQRKCIAWLERYLADGGTLLLVSHSLYHVQKLCQRALWLHQGKLAAEGDVFEVTQAYMAHHEARLAHSDSDDPSCAAAVAVTDLVLGESRADRARLAQGSWLRMRARVDGPADAIEVELRRNDDSVISGQQLGLTSPGGLDLELDCSALLPGRYQVRLTPTAAGRRAGPALRRLLEITGQSREFGSVRLPHRWITPP